MVGQSRIEDFNPKVFVVLCVVDVLCCCCIVLLLYCVVYLLCVSKVRVLIQKKLTRSQLSPAGWREKELKIFPDCNFSP